MSLIAGKASFSRFLIHGLDVQKIKSVLDQKLKENVISPIGDREAREESYGFCNPFDESLDFPDSHEFMSSGYLCLGMRLDSKIVPSKLLKIRLGEATKSLKLQMNTSKLPKAVLAEAKERIKLHLLETIPPSITITKAVLDMDNGKLYIETFSKKMLERFEELFVRSFSLPMIPLVPGTLRVTKENYKGLLGVCPLHMYNDIEI